MIPEIFEWFGSYVFFATVFFGMVFQMSGTHAAFISWQLKKSNSISKRYCWAKLSSSIYLNWHTLFCLISKLIKALQDKICHRCVRNWRNFCPLLKRQEVKWTGHVWRKASSVLINAQLPYECSKFRRTLSSVLTVATWDNINLIKTFCGRKIQLTWLYIYPWEEGIIKDDILVIGYPSSRYHHRHDASGHFGNTSSVRRDPLD